MGTIEQAAAVLADAERRLGELVGSAAGAGQYDLAMQLTQWAKTLAALRAGGVEECATLPLPADTLPPTPAARTAGAGERPRPAGSRGRRTPTKGEYPKFFRRGDQLVKIGWSKKERKEYEHKATRRTVELLADAIGRKGANGKLFTSEDVLPLTDPTDGSEVPGYQGYVALAWLKTTGLIRQNGRRGYSARKGTSMLDGATAFWAGLSEHES